ncbi:hypothetical protein BST45_03120 [Mycobacterium shinjukuense]|nr:hypothetical protein BST45_03120 [Mycobacterium shinjukuense]
MKTSWRLAATTFAMTAALGPVGLGAATQAPARLTPLPQWCPGEFWDPGWGDNWDTGSCHDNWRGPGPNTHPGPGYGPPGVGGPTPGQGAPGPGGPGGPR